MSDETTLTQSSRTHSSSWLHLLTPWVLLRVVYRSGAVLAVLCYATVRFVTHRSGVRRAHQLAQHVATTLLRIACVTVERQGEPPGERGLTVCNHRSYIDILAVLSAAPTSFLCKKEVGRWPLIGTMARKMGVVFVDRKSSESRRESLTRVAQAVLGGQTLTAFPEGTTTRGPGMQDTRPGLFLAAAQHDFALLPAVIEYADPDDAWVGDDTLLRHCLFWLAKPRGKVTLRIGPALRHSDTAPESLQERAEDWMRRALRDLNS